jgi:hypothetical protein
MGTTAVIGLGLLAWVLLAILGALFVGRMIRLRDSQRPDRPEAGGTSGARVGDGAESFHSRPGASSTQRDSPCHGDLPS